jgi:hypothetical protein
MQYGDHSPDETIAITQALLRERLFTFCIWKPAGAYDIIGLIIG